MIYRINKTKDFSVMSNAHLRDKNLSFKAKGLLSMMLSLPDNWDYSIEGIASISKESSSAIKSTLTELKEQGYLIVTKKMPNETESGRIEYIYDIYETKQEGEKQGVENQPLEFLPLEVQPLENQRQINTNILNTKEINTKELNTYININVEFEELWRKYPKKQGKKEAFSHYKATRKKASFEEIEKGLNNYLMYIKSNNIEQRYIKNGSTWFNGHYEDEYETPRETSYDSEAVKKKAQQEIVYKRKGG